MVNHADGTLAEGVAHAMRPFGWWLVEMEEVREAKSDSRDRIDDLFRRCWRIEITWVVLGVPAFLLVIRYVVEAVGRSRGGEPPEDFTQTYAFVWPRIIMLHLMILLCWTVAWGGFAFSSVHMKGAIDQGTIRVVSVVVFLGCEAGAEIYMTLRPSRRTPGRDPEDSSARPFSSADGAGW